MLCGAAPKTLFHTLRLSAANRHLCSGGGAAKPRQVKISFLADGETSSLPAGFFIVFFVPAWSLDRKFILPHLFNRLV
jgi:hypothetical protein